MDFAPAGSACTLPIALHEVVSYSRIRPLLPVTARMLEVGENARQHVPWPGVGLNRLTTRRVRASRTTIPLSPPTAITDPSRLNPIWPESPLTRTGRPRSRPVEAFHSMT